MDIWTILRRAVALFPDKVAAVDAGRCLTYREVGERSGALARFFRSRGIGAQERIAILEVNSHAFLEAYYAAAGAGAILAPLNYRLSADEIAFILRDSGARWLIAGSRFASLVDAALAGGVSLDGVLWIGKPTHLAAGTSNLEYEEAIDSRRGPFDPEAIDENQAAHLYYTSGTTGQPKGVVLTHRNVCRHALGAIVELGMVDSDVWGHFAPMFHLADAWATFAVTWVGGRHVLVHQFEAGEALAAIERERITLSNLIPTMLTLMVNHPRSGGRDLSSLRLILSGGAPIAPELVKRIMETFGCDYVQTYGMTETSPYLTMSLLKEHLKRLPAAEQLRYKSKTGRPCLMVELKVVDDNGVPVVADDQQVGEIWVRGDTVTPGYWNRPSETQAAFRDGWLRTGDLAVVDAEGYVNIVDRKKDMVITGGENVYCIEVENVLYQHSKVLEAAVFGVPDATWGEAVKAAVVLREGEAATEDELIVFCKKRLASYKTPKIVEFLSELPKTGTGKISKKALRERPVRCGPVRRE